MHRLDLDDPAERLLGRALRRQAEKAGDLPFLVTEDRTLSYGRANELANAWAAGLARLGARAGEPVALFMESGPECVLAAFGTLVRLGERQVAALAEGLAACGLPVLWALPERHHRLVAARWPSIRVEAFVPQATLLSRDAVRAFVTHAGANSAVEAMYWGRPMLGLPFMFDQHHFAGRAVALSMTRAAPF